jgi:hypothetical protein
MAVSMQGAAPSEPVHAGAVPGKPVDGLHWGEIGFLVLLAAALVCVFLSGRFAWREASLFQQAKDNGQALLQWANAVAASHDGKGALAPTVCLRDAGGGDGADAAGAAGVTTALTWQQCREQLLGAQGALAGVQNPFGGRAPAFSAACERGHYAGRGAMAVEKGTASPPGFPPSVGYGPIEDDEPLVRGLMLRVLVCDPSGYGTRVGEVKL